ncbi:MAG: hypothetical protein ACRDT6_20060 [Micromonosporaceae bacterium]
MRAVGRAAVPRRRSRPAVPHRCGYGEPCVRRDATDVFPIQLGDRRQDAPALGEWGILTGIVLGAVGVVGLITWYVLGALS